MKRDSNTLREIGEALYGPNWQTPLSVALGVSDRTVRYWTEGRHIPAGVWDDLAKLCEQRARAILKWGARLKAKGP
jgi:hypothetical protein